MRFTLLGSGAVRNNPRRAGPSQILQFKGHNGEASRTWMFDCGRSACLRLAQQEVAAENVDRLFLTHLHFDHVVDVPYFVYVGWNNGRRNPLRIYGPVGTAHFIEHLIRPPFRDDINSRLGHGKKEFGLDPEVVEIDSAGDVLHEEGCVLSAVFTDHGGITTLCYRVEAEQQRVIISGDGLPQEGFEEFAHGADLMVYECSGTAEFLAQQPWGTWHITPEALGALASRCAVRRLMIKHLVIEDITGELDAVNDMGERIRVHFDGEVIVGADGSGVDLG
ncbi:MAG: MBL fold metallo-hydrolase [Candidatus Latescibacteria bacterium]|jgi:ribonuclease Z|nr:MBL fold metallo-hydrolase [Candidatus Latescibacterota bacterium]HJP29791.1 MBL fold metallo-hydrolase [Candidatus Latescibacterota bacterium]